MQYIRTKDGRIIDLSRYVYDETAHWYREKIKLVDHFGLHHFCWKEDFDKIPDCFGKMLVEQLDKQECKFANDIEKLCDCFIKIKRNKGCKDFILKFDHTDLARLKEQKLKYPESPVYGAIHVENKGLIYVARMNDKGDWELL